MATDYYRDYFNIDPDYFPAVNESVIKNNPDMWLKYYPHETFVNLIKTTVSVLSRKQKLSIWVEGAYGTGKSHAILTLKKLLDADEENTRKYFEKYPTLKYDLFNQLQSLKSAGRILTVHRYGSSSIRSDDDLVLAIQESIEKALESECIQNKAGLSLKESIITYLSDEENRQSFDIYANGSYKELFGGDTAEVIIEKLKTYPDEALHILMNKLFKYGKEHRVFTINITDLVNWIKEVITENNLSSIVFFWDEFSEYFYNNTRSLTGFQELCELSETTPFCLVIVTHISSGLVSEGDKDFKKLNDRFVNPHSHISLPENIAFQLIGAALEKVDDPLIKSDWNIIVDDLSSRTKQSRNLIKSKAKINNQELCGILPIQPYAALVLKHISSAFDSNQRSMFDFIKNDNGDKIRGFQWFIDNFGPYSDNPLLTIDYLWDYFYEKNREYLAHDIRSILDYYSRSSNSDLENDEKRVLKTILLLQAISQHAGDVVELFIPNEKSVDFAFEGSDLEDAASRIAEKLVRDKILFKKSLGGEKYQYNAYITEINSEEIEKFKLEVDRKTTASLIVDPLQDQTTVANAISLDGSLKLRYSLICVSLSDFDIKIREIKGNLQKYENKIVAFVTFAKTDAESEQIQKKIVAHLEDEDLDVVYIETLTCFGSDAYSQYRDELAQAMYQRGKDHTLADQCANNAKEYLRKWKNQISEGQFRVYSKNKKAGERANTMDSLLDLLKSENRSRFNLCLESEYTVLPTMYTATNLKLGVECGATQTLRQGYLSSNSHTKIDMALAGAWNVPSYWKSQPALYISKLKKIVDEHIFNVFKVTGRISVKEIWDLVKCSPYGFMPCNFSALILGFILKEYTNGKYSWTDGLTTDELGIDKLKESVSEVISLDITPNPRYKEKYIVTLTDEEKKFNESTATIFDISPKYCTSIEQTREQIRKKLKEYSFPIWVLKSDLEEFHLKTKSPIISKLIDNYCGIANNNNLGGMKTDNDIALEIGKLILDNPDAESDLKNILSKDNCKSSMTKYLHEYRDGELIRLSEEIGDSGQFINELRSKFDADAANWVWNIDTANQKIDELILEYDIVAESNKVLTKSTSFNSAIREWINKCGYFRISFSLAKGYLENLTPLMELLYSIKKSDNILDSQKELFDKLIKEHSAEFRDFCNNQEIVFRKACAFYVEGLSNEDVEKIYKSLPIGCFTIEKSQYLTEVEEKVRLFKASQKSEQLRTLWRKMTNTDSPREWSRKHTMPILCLVDDNDYSKAKSALDTIGNKVATEQSIEKAISYLKDAEFLKNLSDEHLLNNLFIKCIVKDYSVLLTDLDEVKEYLLQHISLEPYDWYGLPEVDRRLKQMAEAKYQTRGVNNALEMIDNLDPAQLKQYFKELVKESMVVGMEIIKKG